MSKQFRRTFSSLILRREKKKLSGVSNLKQTNRKQKKKNSLDKQKSSKTMNQANANQKNLSDNSEEKSTSVFVTNKC